MKYRKPIPGWTKEVCELKQHIKYCYRVWLANGRPNQGQVHTDKQRFYSIYHQAVRRLKRNVKMNEAEVLLEAAQQGDMNL